MDRLDFVTTTIRAASAELMRLRESVLDVRIKNGDPKNIVTDADLRINTLIVDAIKKEFSEEKIYSEETGGDATSKGPLWIIDPIDGTANFSRGIPHFAIVLGLLEDGVPTLGAVFNPVTSEMFSFEKGRGAFLNDTPIHVSAVTELSKAYVLLHAGRKDGLEQWGGESYTKLLGGAFKTSNLSCASLDTCFVAAGRVEASVYGTFTTIDTAPALGILFEAGGVAGGKEDSAPEFSADPQPVIAANNNEILREVQHLLFT